MPVYERRGRAAFDPREQEEAKRVAQSYKYPGIVSLGEFTSGKPSYHPDDSIPRQNYYG